MGKIMADRPVECSQCTKCISVHYKEIAEGSITETCLCADCPILRKKLKGQDTLLESCGWSDSASGLYCGTCGTRLESFLMGNPLGCFHCYEVFSTIIVRELKRRDKIHLSLKRKESVTPSTPFHIGKTPGKHTKRAASSQLKALSEALNEALRKENYEEAAWLRDQIKQLTENDGLSN